MVVNIHTRTYAAPVSAVTALMATLASPDDGVWPHESWPRMRFDHGLTPGAHGGHGPVRYRVERVDPGSEVAFTFTSPPGFHGGHAFTVTPVGVDKTRVTHEIGMRLHGWALLTWPLFFRPLHDALLEEALDALGLHLGEPPRQPHQRSLWVRVLRRGARLTR